MDVLVPIALICIWLIIALGLPAFVKGLRKDGGWDIPPWWSPLAAIGIIWLINWYYEEHSKLAKAQQVLRELTGHVEDNNYRSAVTGLKDAAFDRSDWDVDW